MVLHHHLPKKRYKVVRQDMLYPERVQESKVDVYFLGYSKEEGLKHTYNAALTSATECRQSKANTERENMKECGSCNRLKESTGLIV